MAYNKTIWVDNVTLLSAQNYNNMENGIEEANNKATENSTQLADITNYDFQMLDKDANGIYARFEEYRADDTLFRKTVLSNADVNGNYQTETQTKYDTDGVTVLDTKTFTLVYDADNKLYQRDEVIV